MKCLLRLYFNLICKRISMIFDLRINMRLLTVLFLLGTTTYAQVFIQDGNKLRFYKDKSAKDTLSPYTIDQCWCDEVYGKDTTDILYLKPKYEVKGRVLLKIDGLWALMDKSGKLLERPNSTNPYTYSEYGSKVLMEGFSDKGFTIKGNGTSTLTIRDTSGQIKKQFYVRDDYKGYFLASEDNDAWGMSTVNMKTVLQMKYDPARSSYHNFRFNETGLVVMESKGNDNKYGIVKYTGQVMAGFRFDFMVDYITNEDTIYAEINAKKGYINKTGNIVFPLIHEKLPMELTDSNLVATEKYVWIMDRNFKQIKDYRYQKLEREGDVYFYKKNNLWGVLDLNLQPIIKAQYNSMDDGPRIKDQPDFKTYVVVKSGKIGVIDVNGNVIIPPKYNCRCTLGYFSPEGYFIELANGDRAYRFNEKGEVVSESSARGKACLCESYE